MEKSSHFLFSVGNVCAFYGNPTKNISRVRGIWAPLIFIFEEIDANPTVYKDLRRAIKKGYFQKSIGLCLQGLTSKVGKSSLPEKVNETLGNN